jgi:sulfoxide reductase heme-binding subunit YedZ
MSKRNLIILKTIAWLACLGPLAMLVWQSLHAQLGPNPVETMQLSTGTTALVLLLATLAVSPLRRLTGQNWLIKFRRLLGLFAFFYGCLHFATYLVFDQEFDFNAIAGDIYKRPFILVGFLALVLMLPLAITSTNWSIRKLGGKRWQWLHRLVYFSAAAAVVHFWWKVKADHTEPAFYGAIFIALMVYRFWVWTAPKKQAQAPKPVAAGD